MKFVSTSISGLLIIEPRLFEDDRGFFMETFQEKIFFEAGIQDQFVQDNHSGSKHGILRGLHYQVRQPQGKLVRVVVGEVFDVAVDLRQDSPTFGKWEGLLLSAQNKLQLWIPAGFAHGFLVLSDWAEVIYKATDFYAPQWERTLLWNDPEIGIEWPEIEGIKPLLSQKDMQGKRLKDADVFEHISAQTQPGIGG